MEKFIQKTLEAIVGLAAIPVILYTMKLIIVIMLLTFWAVGKMPPKISWVICDILHIATANSSACEDRAF